MTQHIHLGEHLVHAGLLNQEQIQSALHLQRQKGGFLGQILVSEGWITGLSLLRGIIQPHRNNHPSKI